MRARTHTRTHTHTHTHTRREPQEWGQSKKKKKGKRRRSLLRRAALGVSVVRTGDTVCGCSSDAQTHSTHTRARAHTRKHSATTAMRGPAPYGLLPTCGSAHTAMEHLGRRQRLHLHGQLRWWGLGPTRVAHVHHKSMLPQRRGGRECKTGIAGPIGPRNWRLHRRCADAVHQPVLKRSVALRVRPGRRVCGDGEGVERGGAGARADAQEWAAAGGLRQQCGVYVRPPLPSAPGWHYIRGNVVALFVCSVTM